MSYDIDQIEGIGPAHRHKLAQAGITHLDHLLSRCGTQSGRREVARSTGISETHLLSWTNMADLMRIPGIGRQFAELLHAAGVDTVDELAHRRADHLTARIHSVNSDKKLSRATPSIRQVEAWVQLAGTLKSALSH